MNQPKSLLCTAPKISVNPFQLGAIAAVVAAFALAPTQARAQTPTSWVNAASENQSFTVNEPTLVRYGARNNWVQRTVNGSVKCTNSFFGRDPLYGVRKTCQIPSKTDTARAQATVDQSKWVKAVNEHESFRVLALTEVRYGVGNNWIQRNLNGAISCTNSFFGRDPAPGVFKSCEIPSKASTPVAPSLVPVGWAKAVDENQTFSVKGPAEVRYGVGNNWIQRTNLNGTVSCTNSFFGRDPAQGIVKSCQVPNAQLIATATTPPPTVSTAPRPSPTPITTPSPFPITTPAPAPAPQLPPAPVATPQLPAAPVPTAQLPSTPPPPVTQPPAAPAPVTQPPAAPAPVAQPSAPTPVAPFSCDAAAITCLQITSTGNTTQASVPLTFGQPFKAGDWRASSQGLVAKVDGAVIPAQVDEVSSHRDGSTRFAVVSAQLSNLGAGQSKIINLYTGAKTAQTPVVPANPDWNLEVETQLFDDSGNVTATLVAKPQAQLVAQIANNNGRRLSGAVASEYTVVTDFKDKSTGVKHPHLSARFHTRLVDGGSRIRTDVVMENTRTFTAAPGNITYSMVVKRNGATLHTQPKFTHNHHARWHKVVWSGSGAEPQARVLHHMPYFLASRAVWNYDLSVKIPESSLASRHANFLKKRSEQAAMGPMANLMLTPAFGSTGGRPEIGPLPQWTAVYLVSQDDRAREVMMALADTAGAVPVHYRDEDSGSPVDLERRPQIALRVVRHLSQPPLPAMVNGETIWTADVAHQASFSYVPYLLTGDAYYQDEMMFWASWNMAGLNPEYRGRGTGLLNTEQVRGQAWGMRALGEVSRALPDGHEMKPYFQSRLANNLQWFHEAYITKPKPRRSPLGATFDDYMGDRTAPWQGDYMAIVLAQLVENGEPLASDILNWISRFNIGRVTSDAQGFCAARAPGYFWTVKAKDGPMFNTWSEVTAANYPADVGKSCTDVPVTDGYPLWAGGYAATIRTMLAATANVNVPNARTAYDKWKGMTPGMDKDYANDPTWAIVPR